MAAVSAAMTRSRSLLRPLLVAALATGALATTSARAELAEGAQAPDFVTQGAKGGTAFNFQLKAALKKGPVVLYFFPKAFTQGCTLEAHAFAEAMPQFHKAGATVLGLSADDLPTLKRFSTEECRAAFPVATATPAMIKAYDVALVRDGRPLGVTTRASYVVAPDGRITMVYSNLDWHDHVAKTLAAVEAIKAHH